MNNFDIHPRAKALMDELFFVADEYITTDTAKQLAQDLGYPDIDLSDYDLG